MSANSHDIRQVLELIQSHSKDERMLIAIAGPPGSGKSTLSEAVVDHLNEETSGLASLVPMDGFHLDNSDLIKMGMLERKGAPQTFDSSGLVDLVKRLKTAESNVRYPLFNRELDTTLPDAGEVARDTQIVVIEGNYLLLDEAIWRDLGNLFDLTVFISSPIAVLKQRLIRRWIDHGYSPEEAIAKAKGNDLLNAQTVLDKSTQADLVIIQTPAPLEESV